MASLMLAWYLLFLQTFQLRAHIYQVWKVKEKSLAIDEIILDIISERYLENQSWMMKSEIKKQYKTLWILKTIQSWLEWETVQIQQKVKTLSCRWNLTNQLGPLPYWIRHLWAQWSICQVSVTNVYPLYIPISFIAFAEASLSWKIYTHKVIKNLIDPE